MFDHLPPLTNTGRKDPFLTAQEFADARRSLTTKAPDKPTTAPFTIVVDTREQTPLIFDPEIPTIRATLQTGDYSIKGFTDQFTVERKSLADAIHTVIHDRARFVRELERMRPFLFKRIVVTASFAKVLRGKYDHSRANPNSVIGLLRSLEIAYDVPITFADDAKQAARHITDWARHFFNRRVLIANAKHTQPRDVGSSRTPLPCHRMRDGDALDAIPPTKLICNQLQPTPQPNDRT